MKMHDHSVFPRNPLRKRTGVAFRYLTLVACMSAGVLVVGDESARAQDDGKARVDVELHRMIPLRDGVELAATIWKPAAMEEPLPSVLVLTPYVSDETHSRALKFARAGYAYVSVDVRGRGSSDGEYRPMYGHGPDGAEVVEWIASRPWSDGRVAMRGGSYRGMTQWQVMARDPEHLVAAIPTAAAYPGHDFPSPRGIMLTYAARWLAFTSGNTRNGNLFGDWDHWRRHFVDHYMQRKPFESLAGMAGANRDTFLQWLDHPAYDAYWADYNPAPEDYAGIDIPILTVTGYFDGDQPGALRYYREHMHHAPENARGNHYLLVGPWDHGGTRYHNNKVGGLQFPDNAVVDLDQLQIDWLDWILKDGKRPELLGDRVTWYVMGEGANEWRSSSTLEGISRATRRLYLSSPEGNPGSVFDGGRLLTGRPSGEEADSYRYDPRVLKDRATLMEDRSETYLVDPLDAHGEQVLVYHGDALDEALTIAGAMRFVGHVSMDVPDTDIAAEVQAVLPDGDTLVLGYDAVRARYRKGPDPMMAEPGVVERYVFDGFFLTARRLPAGSRLRLVVFPLDAPDFQRNFNTGGRPGYERIEDARVANVKLHLDGDHASYLELPFVE